MLWAPSSPKREGHDISSEKKMVWPQFMFDCRCPAFTNTVFHYFLCLAQYSITHDYQPLFGQGIKPNTKESGGNQAYQHMLLVPEFTVTHVSNTCFLDIWLICFNFASKLALISNIILGISCNLMLEIHDILGHLAQGEGLEVSLPLLVNIT